MDVPINYLDISRYEEDYGALRPSSLEEGIRKTAEFMKEYCRHIDRSRVQFDFLCDADSNAIPKEEIESLGGHVYVIAPYQNIVKNMCDIKRICKENQYDIIHGYNGTMNIFAMFTGWMCGIPVRINESISMAHKADKKTFVKSILKPFSKCFATHYMANGEVCGRWQFGDKLYDAGKVAVFKTVIDVDKNKYDEELRIRIRKELEIEDNLVIGHIGRLTAQKNTLFIIDIFVEILKKEPKAKLLIVGDGELRSVMTQKIMDANIQDAVLDLGRREDIQQFYNAMDCFLLPSLYEGLPVVGVEAETCGLPVFFSTEIPEESSACSELGYFIGLDVSATQWAEIILAKILKNIAIRRDYANEVKNEGFDSGIEGFKLANYYSQLFMKNKDAV